MKKLFLLLVICLMQKFSYSQANDDARHYQNSLKSKFPKVVRNSHEPQEVIDQLYDAVNRHMDTSDIKLTDTLGILLQSNKHFVITYQNFRYTYKIWDDTLSLNAELVKKEKLFYRPYTALGVVVFSESMSTMLLFNSIDIPKDKKLHTLAGLAISTGVGAFVYYKTKRKWLSAGAGLIAGSLAGLGKEWVDSKTGGVVSNLDAKYTIGGAFAGAISIRFTLHN